VSFWRLYYHLVWATKNREHLITPQIEERLFAYLVRKADEFEVRVYAINGWYDHVHMLVAIPPKHAIAWIVKNLKGSSSRYFAAHEQLTLDWQRGYGVLSLGERQRPFVEEYIRNQKQHHAAQTIYTRLEYVAPFDEGPTDPGLTLDSVHPYIYESSATYTTDDSPI
jgi:putative transposase